VVSNYTAVRRFDVLARQTNFTIVPSADANLKDITTVSGRANLVVIANRFGWSSTGEIRVFDNGVPRPTAIHIWQNPQLSDLERASIPDLVYAIQSDLFSRLSIGPTGISVQAAAGGLIIPGTSYKATDGFIYAVSGQIINPQLLQLAGSYPGGSGSLVEVDASVQRTIFLAPQAGPYNYVLRAYDQDELLAVEALGLAGVQGSPTRLVRYGTNGLAFSTGNQLVLVESPILIPSLSCADLNVAQEITPDPSSSGSNFICTITVSNLGPNVANRVTVKDTLPLTTTVVSSSFTHGDAILQGGILSWRFSELPAGATASARLVLVPVSASLLTNSIVVYSRTADTNFGNNVSTATPQLPPVDLALSQSYLPNPAIIGSNVTYFVTVSNASAMPAWQVLVVDQLPAGSMLLSSNTLQGLLTYSNGVVKWRISGLAPRAVATVC